MKSIISFRFSTNNLLLNLSLSNIFKTGVKIRFFLYLLGESIFIVQNIALTFFFRFSFGGLIFLKTRIQQYQRPNLSIGMNLKYNRIDMKKSVADPSYSMKLRKRPFSSKTQKPPLINKPKPKVRKEERLFGTDLTNRPLASAIQAAMEEEVELPPSQVQPYLASILNHIDQLDASFLSLITAQLTAYPSNAQFAVTPDMRRILLRWLLQVGKKFQIQHETMHICVQMIDFMLIFESDRINKNNFQLLGVTSLFVASKYNEIHTWEAEKYIFVCDGLYSVEQLFDMEGVILLATRFNLQFPTIHQFAGLTLEQHGQKLTNIVLMLSNLALFDFTLFNRFKKRHLASVIIYLALKLENPDKIRSRDVIQQGSIPEDIFRECSKMLLELYQQREQSHI